MTKTQSTPSTHAVSTHRASNQIEHSSDIPYGAWPSDITSEQLTTNTVRLSEPYLDHGNAYWLEQRPEEQGRCAVVCQPADTNLPPVDITPASMSVRSKVHEYGGGSYCVSDNVIYFVNGNDQRVYSMPIDLISPHVHSPLALSPENSQQVNYRYADLFIDTHRQQLIAVCEIHRNLDAQEPENTIISLRLDGSSAIGFNVLVFGGDFYSNPSVSPDHEKLTWLTWNHPDMPWDNSECWIADFTHAGMLHKHRKVAGGVSAQHPSGESIFQPQWSPTGDLLFVSDRNNWWNIYSYNTYNKYTEILVDMPAEFATPQWVFGMSTYGFLNSYTIFCTYTRHGEWHLATIDLLSHNVTQHTSPFTDIHAIACQDDNDTALFIGANSQQSESLILWKKEQWKPIAHSSELAIPCEQLSTPEKVTFTNSHNQDVYGFFYPPKNSSISAPSDTESRPPLIVMCHGGPTGATGTGLNLKIQYWTNRGFSVFDINYSGSTGYGRDYRRRLYQQWGVLDVDDIRSGTHYLIEQKKVDPDRIAIRGSSAGGYSVLAALTFTDTFKVGASLYGIGDLSALAEDTHKFESRYCDQLVGIFPENNHSEKHAQYTARSPLHHVDKLNCPVIFLQGVDDKVVPPNQAEAMVRALCAKNIPVAYIAFANEGHGFRQAKNIRYAIDVEYAFYAFIFDLPIDSPITDIPFVTLDTMDDALSRPTSINSETKE